jgi:hypothetical protein
MSQIPVEKTVFNKDLSKVINTQFRQLGQTEGLGTEISLDDFFRLYDDLFYIIPKEGDINSHRYILNREAEYLGVGITDEIDIQALLDEITNLRQELLDANKNLTEISPGTNLTIQ